MRTRHREKGQSLVEFGLILPIFFLLVLGLIDFGRAVYAYSTVNNAARQASRLAIVDQTEDHIREKAADDAVSLGIDESAITVDFWLVEDPDAACPYEVPGDDNNLAGMTQCIAAVTVPYTYRAATPLIGNIVGDVTVSGESRFKVEFNCEGPECPIGE